VENDSTAKKGLGLLFYQDAITSMQKLAIDIQTEIDSGD